MIKKKVLWNIITSVFLQLSVLLNGLIVPRLILTTFGSEVNGLIASINQFLSYITLVEGGVGAVILSALYQPLANGDTYHIKGIMNAASAFFQKLAIGFLIYAVMLAFLFPFIMNTDFEWFYIFSLVIILCIGLFIQYYFSIVLRLLLTADQRVGVCNCISIFMMIINILITIVCIRVFPSIHFVKFISIIIYLIQPTILIRYVNKHYNLPATKYLDKKSIEQRWNGFGQNLAHFIHTNTDIVILTFFTTLFDVSVYSIYYSVIVGIRGLVLSISMGFSAYLGNAYAEKKTEKLNNIFDNYEFIMFKVTEIVFLCCSVLIVSFVLLYTKGVTDTQYNQPIFAIILVVAEAVYCIRDPYIQLINNAGHFKQTVKYAYIEAILNIVVSVILVNLYGIVGVAIGTLISIIYRMICSIIYLKKNLIYRSINKFLKNLLEVFIVTVFSFLIIKPLETMSESTFFLWTFKGLIIFLIISTLVVLYNMLFNRKILEKLLQSILKREFNFSKKTKNKQ